MHVIDVMKKAAIDAGSYLLQKYRGVLSVDYKTEREPVTDVDKKSEEILMGYIMKNFPDHEIFSEETVTSLNYQRGNNIPLWFIDPLDGTANFIRGISFFCVGLGFYNRGIAEACVVYDPVHEELFSCVKDGGAYMNGRPVTVSRTDFLIKSILATGFPFERTRENDNTDHILNMVPLISDIRRTASGLLDLAYVACGRFDGYFEHELGPWDTGPGALLVEEAGGKVTDYRGKAYNPFKRDICATNGIIHDDVLTVLSRGKSGFN